MKLFIDDDINRHVVFAKRYPGSFQTASLVIAQHELDQSPFYVSELWLDHDLGSSLTNGGFFDPETGDPVGTQTDTIRPLLDWLCRSPVTPRSLVVVIHSWNIPAARSMRDALVAAGFTNVTLRPFSFMEPIE